MANFPTFMPQQQMYPNYMQPRMDAFVSRLVASREEAVATPTDFNTPIVMLDFGHGAVYVKRFNPNTGMGELLDFKQLSPNEAAPTQEYVTRQEFDKFCSELMRRIVGAGKETADE